MFVAFKGDRAYLGVHYDRSLFEPSVFGATSLESLQEMAEQFALAEAVVRELDLNTRVSGKAADDTLLRSDHAPPHILNSPAIISGALTERDVWKLATSSMDEVISDQDEAALRPGDDPC